MNNGLKCWKCGAPPQPGLALLDDREPGPPELRVGADAALLEAVRRGDAPASARVWENGRALVVARGDQRLPRFEAARAALGREGWPVVMRESGGTAVPHGPGVLLLSLAFRPPAGAACTLEATYALLCAPLADALARLGVPSAPGSAPGSFCDGRFDLVACGRKIAGTAQRWLAWPVAASPERGAAGRELPTLVRELRGAFLGHIDTLTRYHPLGLSAPRGPGHGAG